MFAREGEDVLVAHSCQEKDVAIIVVMMDGAIMHLMVVVCALIMHANLYQYKSFHLRKIFSLYRNLNSQHIGGLII